MTVRSPENILLLRYSAFNVCAAGHIGVRHVEDSKALAMILCEPEGTAAQRFARQDTDKDGKLTLTEFVGKRPKDKIEAAKKAFSRRDKNDD